MAPPDLTPADHLCRHCTWLRRGFTWRLRCNVLTAIAGMQDGWGEVRTVVHGLRVVYGRQPIGDLVSVSRVFRRWLPRPCIAIAQSVGVSAHNELHMCCQMSLERLLAESGSRKAYVLGARECRPTCISVRQQRTVVRAGEGRVHGDGSRGGSRWRAATAAHDARPHRLRQQLSNLRHLRLQLRRVAGRAAEAARGRVISLLTAWIAPATEPDCTSDSRYARRPIPPAS